MVIAALDVDNPVFRMFIGHGALVLAKTCGMSVLTSFYRMTKKVFINEEDTGFGGKRVQIVTNDPDVERIRRCHLNDLENVIPFVLLGLLYVSTGPSQSTAAIHFRVFTISRFLHSFFYLCAIPQPTRAIAFFVGLGVNASMAYSVIRQAAF